MTGWSFSDHLIAPKMGYFTSKMVKKLVFRGIFELAWNLHIRRAARKNSQPTIMARTYKYDFEKLQRALSKMSEEARADLLMDIIDLQLPALQECSDAYPDDEPLLNSLSMVIEESCITIHLNVCFPKSGLLNLEADLELTPAGQSRWCNLSA